MHGNLENGVTCLAPMRASLAVLGLDPLTPGWRAGGQDGRLREVDERAGATNVMNFAELL
jgi:hypothetical protein